MWPKASCGRGVLQFAGRETTAGNSRRSFLGSGVSRVSLTTEVTEATEVGAAVTGCFAQQRRVALLAWCGVVF